MFIALLAIMAAQNPMAAPAPTLRYRVEAKTTHDQDLTSIGRGKVSGSLATTAFISVTSVDSADGQVARITVDSMKLVPTGAMAIQLTPAAANAASDSARGAWLHAYSVRGALRGVPQPSIQNPALAPIMQAVSVMFPGIRSGIKLGDSWADTTKIDGDVQGGHQSGSIVATWHVTGILNGGLILGGTAITAVTTNGQDGQTLTVTGSSREQLSMAVRGPSLSASIESVRDAATVTKPGTTPILSRTVASLSLTQLP